MSTTRAFSIDDPPPNPNAADFVDEALYGRRADEPWPAPDLSLLIDERIPAPPVPPDVLPPLWERWTREAAEGAGAPQAFVVGALLSAAGALIGNSRWVSPWAQWREPPILNVALVGRPSSGKSPAMDQISGPLVALETDINADWGQRRRDHKRDVLEAAERLKIYESDVKEAVTRNLPPPEMPASAEIPPKIQRRRIFTVDPTIEAAARLSDGNPRGLLLIRDELSGWIASMDRYAAGAGGDRAFWLQSYGGRPWTTDRVKNDDPVIIPHLLWTILGTIQPDRVSSLLLAGDDDGLAARLLYVWPDPLPPARPACRADDEGAQARMGRLLQLPWESPHPKILPFSEAAIDALVAWRREVATLEGEASGFLVSWIGKLPGMAARAALILEHLEWSETAPETPAPEAISERSALAAIVFLADFALPMARRTFGAAALPEAERDARRLARWLNKQTPIPEIVNAKALRRLAAGPAIPDSARMDAALAELAAAGWCRPAPVRAGDTAGRARKDWALNPALRERRQ